jgi:hypothetical protein
MANDQMVEYIRTLVTGDFEGRDQVEDELNEAGWEGWP